MEATEPKWVDSISDIIEVNSLSAWRPPYLIKHDSSDKQIHDRVLINYLKYANNLISKELISRVFEE